MLGFPGGRAGGASWRVSGAGRLPRGAAPAFAPALWGVGPPSPHPPRATHRRPPRRRREAGAGGVGEEQRQGHGGPVPGGLEVELVSGRGQEIPDLESRLFICFGADKGEEVAGGVVRMLATSNAPPLVCLAGGWGRATLPARVVRHQVHPNWQKGPALPPSIGPQTAAAGPMPPASTGSSNEFQIVQKRTVPTLYMSARALSYFSSFASAAAAPRNQN